VPCVSVGGNGINHGEVTQVVTRDTRWPAGTPCWVDVSADDVPKAIAFYQALFGWDIELGGRIVQPPGDTPYGRIGVVADNEGAVFSVITPPAS